MSRIRSGLLPLLAVALSLGVSLMAGTQHFSPWTTAQNIGPLVDPVATDDASSCLSRDGRVMYFVSNRPGGVGRYDIWVARWDDALLAWGAPVNLGPNVNSVLGDFTPALSRDEHWLFFASNRPGSLGRRDLYVSYRQHTHDDLAWEPAVNLGPIVNSIEDEFGVTYFENDEAGGPQLFFSSTRTGGNFDIYMTEIDMQGSFTAPVPIAALATEHVELTPSISHDGLELFFSSARPGGAGGNDIWVSTRQSVFDVWSEPVNAGPGVNTEADEIYPALAADRGTLMFMRGLVGSTPPTGSIWISTRSKVHP